MSVKFKINPANAKEMLDKQLMMADPKEKIYYMTFRINLKEESWDLVATGKKPDYWDEMLKSIDPTTAHHIFVRGAEKAEKPDAWIKYCPDDAPSRVNFCFSSASGSLVEGIKSPKAQATFRNVADIKKDDKDLRTIFEPKK